MRLQLIMITVVVAALASGITTWVIPSVVVRAMRDPNTVHAKRVEIVDSTGVARIVMEVDPQGNAKISFRGPNNTMNSEFIQTTSGEMTMRFAGAAQRPSVFVGSGLSVGGPRIEMNGNSPSDQKILLGFLVDDVPTKRSDSWGLFLPTAAGSGYYVGVGAGRIPGKTETHGFIMPAK